MLGRKANREDADQTASSDVLRSGSALSRSFGQATIVQILEHLL